MILIEKSIRFMQAEDAVLIDNSALSIEDQNDLIDNLINTKK